MLDGSFVAVFLICVFTVFLVHFDGVRFTLEVSVERLKLKDLICKLHPVTEVFLREMKNIFDTWYPLTQDGCEVDMDASKILFNEKREVLMAELTENAYGPVRDPMPCMRHNARRNTVEHPKLGTIGCSYFFGGESRNLDATSFLSSPLWLGERVRVRWSAKIVGPSLIESHVFMNTSSVITRSVICAGSQIDDLAVVKDSILGRRVFVEPGVKILHRFGFDCEEIMIRDMRMKPGSLIRTGRRKLGAIIGDGCRIGANSVIEPGTVLLPGCEVPRGCFLPSGVYAPSFFTESDNRETLMHGCFPNCS